MLHEVVYNLCDNAIKYNVPGGNVTIHAENNRLVVSDTGIGIPAEHKDRIFERFYRVDKMWGLHRGCAATMAKMQGCHSPRSQRQRRGISS